MRANYLIATVIAILLAVGAAWYYGVASKAPAGPVACTADAMQCPDGSYVGRTGPNCEFVCPAASSTPQGDGTGVEMNLILGINPDAALGTYLSAFNGMTVYTYAKDSAGVSNCTGACAANWPPYTVPSKASINVPSKSTGIVGTVGTTVRADGTLQVTYDGAPLYFYIQDKAPRDTKGQGLGGVWYVAKP